jgi:spore germination protein YaaH
MQVWGYIPDFDLPAAFASARANRRLITGLTQVRFHLDGDGELAPYAGAQPVPDQVTTGRLPVVPLIANQIAGQWDQEGVARVLGDPARRRRHVERIVTALNAEHAPAVELDYEFLPASLRDVFSAFVEELADALRDNGKALAVAVHAKRSEADPAVGAAAQDWPRIGAVADRVAVMTYDFDPTRPGPIAPLAWTREVLAYAASCLPRPKVMQGIPLYGYRWSEGNTPAYLTHGEFMDLARRSGSQPRRDATDRHLVLEGIEAGTPFQAWLPDAETVGALASIGRELGLAGYTVWRLGGEEPSALVRLREPTSAPGTAGLPGHTG